MTATLEDSRDPRRDRDPILRVDGLQVSYRGGLPVLRGIDLTVLAGEVVVVLGSNGAGKTTLMRAITGLLRGQGGSVTAGTIVFDGSDRHGDTAALVDDGMAQVMEGRRLFRDLTVGENLLLGAATVRDAATRQTLLSAQLDRFPMLADKRNAQAGLLSGGEQQIVAIARALMSRPRFLVLDEPSLGLSPHAVRDVRDLLLALRDDGLTLLLVEQNAEMALSIADHGYVVERGRGVHSGSPSELDASGAVRELVAPTDVPIGRAPTRRLHPQDLPWLR